MKELMIQVQNLAKEELTRANEKFPPFRSVHEGYAVLLEEVEEAEHELTCAMTHIRVLWAEIKGNHVDATTVNNILSFAHLCAAECIQVAAMAEKFLSLLEAQEANKNENTQL